MSNELNGKERIFLMMGPTAMIFAAIVLASVAFGHGDKKHVDDTDSIPAEPQVSEEETGGLGAMKNALDSVYVLIGVSYDSIKPILVNSCYDCHSANTVYPWYYNIPIIHGMIDDDIKEARKHLDMTLGFPLGGHASQTEQLREIKAVIEEGEMPLFSYRLMHSDTKVEGERRDSLFGWIDSSLKSIADVYQSYGYPVPGNNVESQNSHDDDDEDDH